MKKQALKDIKQHIIAHIIAQGRKPLLMDVSDKNVRCAIISDVFFRKKSNKLCILRFNMSTLGIKIKEVEI